jgi:hypothetical protein
MSLWIQLQLPPPHLHIEWIDAQSIKKEFRVKPLEYESLEYKDIESIESKIYQNKLNESRKFYPLQYGSNQRSSLYIDIQNQWIKEPIQVSISDNMILDGLHRIAAAYDINPSRPIPVMFKNYL